MLDRCRNPNNPSYDNYGRRGITFCEDYRSFENFYADVLDPPPGLTLDRVDNDGNYVPSNVRWADRLVQRTNQRPRKAKTSQKPRKESPTDPNEDVPW
jgi:hypothetical protein